MPDFTIRRLAPGDEGDALDAMRRLRGSVWTLEDARSFLADPRNHLMIATVGSDPAGYLFGHEMPRIDGPRPMMCLYDLEVAEPHRRRGIGRALVDALRAAALARGNAKMWVITETDNAPARALYAACGGEQQEGDSVVYCWPMGGQRGEGG